MSKTIISLTIVFLLTSNLMAAETIYPSGYNFTSQNNLNSQSVVINDTLVITKTFINNESFPVSGFYYSENFPQEFELVNQSIKINGSSITYDFDSTITSIFSNNNCFYWLVDDPNGSVQNIINPGDILILEIKLICTLTGSYSFPMHTSSFYGNSTGFFATDNSLTIDITASSDVTPPGGISDLSGG